MMRFALAVAGSAALTPLVVLATMTLLDPFWSIRPQIGVAYVALLAGMTLTILAITALPLAIVIFLRGVDRSGLIAFGNASVGLLLSLPFLLTGHVSPAPVILGAAIAISSLIVSIIFFATKERTSNG